MRTERPHVLLVDDDKVVRQTWGYILDGAFDAVFAESGAAALQLLQHPPGGRPFDVLVTDHRMPGMSGVELCRKARLVSPKTARVIVTAFKDPEVQACPCRLLEKPVQDGMLERVIYEAIAGTPVAPDVARVRESVAEAAHKKARECFRAETAKLLSWEPAGSVSKASST